MIKALAIALTFSTSVLAMTAYADTVRPEGNGLVREQVQYCSGECPDYPYIPSVSTKTREQVQAEYLQAKEQGLLCSGECPDYPYVQSHGSSKTRAQVQAEYLKAKEEGRLPPAGDH